METFSGRVGAGTQMTVPSDAVAASFRLWETEVRPWRSGNDLCDSMRHRVQTRLGHDQSSNTGTQPTRSRMAEACWSERDEAARIRSSQK